MPRAAAAHDPMTLQDSEEATGPSPSTLAPARASSILAALIVLFAAASQGCAARPYRPPPAEPMLDLSSTNGRVLEPAPEGRGLIPPTSRSRVRAMRLDLVTAASGMLGAASPMLNGRSFRADCSGFAQAVYASADIDLSSVSAPPGLNGVAIIHRFVAEEGGLHARRAMPGDLVFFDGTHGPRGRPLTHIGIVERVRSDGTVVFLHHMQGRVVRGHLNRNAPHVHRDPRTGRILNDYLRRGSNGPRLAGELFSAYGTVIR